MMFISDIWLSEEEEAALRGWLAALVERRRREAQQEADDLARDAHESACADQLIDIARAAAERHGPIEGIDSWEQAKAACASWERHAGYMDIAEHFAMDEDYRQLWHDTYSLRINEIRRARAS